MVLFPKHREAMLRPLQVIQMPCHLIPVHSISSIPSHLTPHPSCTFPPLETLQERHHAIIKYQNKAKPAMTPSSGCVYVDIKPDPTQTKRRLLRVCCPAPQCSLTRKKRQQHQLSVLYTATASARGFYARDIRGTRLQTPIYKVKQPRVRM